ncbi:MAG: GNAT family N-acetyltransferase [Leptospiraceae bacterium]|nr:GNAT family N-acetyltransferase [Leptospiraceae bacterium]
MSKKMDILSDLPDTFRKPAVQLFLDSLGEKFVLAMGQGIGHALLTRPEEHGIALGKSRLTLQVVDTNPRAKKLYETLGFRTTGTYNTYPMGRLVGWRFNKVDFMEKTLTSRNRVP